MTLQYDTYCTECTLACIKLHVVPWANLYLQSIHCNILTYTLCMAVIPNTRSIVS